MGQSSVVYLTVGGRACSTMRHLTMVAGLVPSRMCGTQGSWWSSGDEWSTEGGRGRSSLPHRGPAETRSPPRRPPKTLQRTFKRLSKTPKKTLQDLKKTTCLRECSGIYGPPSAGRGLGEHTSLSTSDWTGPTAHLSGAGPWPLPGNPSHSSTQAHTRRVTVSTLQRPLPGNPSQSSTRVHT